MAALAAGAGLESALWQLYRKYYDDAEATRRWSISDDIPWKEARPINDAGFVEMIESLLVVKLKVVDISTKVIPRVRGSFGRTWFYATWGYEELRHNLVLSDWLIASTHHTREQLMALEDAAIAQEWQLPCEDLPGLLVYAVLQEGAMVEWLGKLVRSARELPADRALVNVLDYVLADDRAHYGFFLDCLRLQMQHEPEGLREKAQAAIAAFALPAIAGLADGPRRLDTLGRRGGLDGRTIEQKIGGAILAAIQ